MYASKHRVKDLSNCQLSSDGTVVSIVSIVRNLGVFSDTTPSMDKQVSSLLKSSFHETRNNGRIRNYITKDVCKILVQLLVTSRLDNGNAILYGLPANLINKL